MGFVKRLLFVRGTFYEFQKKKKEIYNLLEYFSSTVINSVSERFTF